MSTSVCLSCHSLLRQRLRVRISYLQHLRYSSTTPSLSWYHDTTAPTSSQLQAAEKFFFTHKPRKLWTATEWRKHSDTADTTTGLIPEVAFLGRSNVGKSSLLNALLISPGLNYVGPRPGKTTTMHAWALSPTDPKTGGAVKGMKGDMKTKCAVLDMPGYGHASHDDWGDEILAYLKNRKQLKRAFVLVDGQHSLKSGDLTMLRLLRKQGISTQIVMSKCDKMKSREIESMVGHLWNRIQGEVGGPGLAVLGEVLVVGSLGDGRRNDKVHYKDMFGVQEVQWAILRATGLEHYAVSKVVPGTKASTPSLDLSDSAETAATSRSTNTYNPLLQSQPEARFSWPAKIRQPHSTTSDVALAERPPPSSLKPMNPTASLSDLLSQPSSAQSKDANTPQALSPASLAGKHSQSPFPVGGIHSGQILAGLQPDSASNIASLKSGEKFDLRHLGKTIVKGREVKDYVASPITSSPPPSSSESIQAPCLVDDMANLKAMIARMTKPPAKYTSTGVGSEGQLTKTHLRNQRKYRHSAREATTSPSLGKLTEQGQSPSANPAEPWTGSAVGGMAELEDMMARTSTKTRIPSPASSKGGSGRKPQRQKMAKHRQIPSEPVALGNFTHQGAPAVSRGPKEVWSGSAVGGMADLEAMMARTARPAAAAAAGGRKRGKRY